MQWLITLFISWLVDCLIVQSQISAVLHMASSFQTVLTVCLSALPMRHVYLQLQARDASSHLRCWSIVRNDLRGSESLNISYTRRPLHQFPGIFSCISDSSWRCARVSFLIQWISYYTSAPYLSSHWLATRRFLHPVLAEPQFHLSSCCSKASFRRMVLAFAWFHFFACTLWTSFENSVPELEKEARPSPSPSRRDESAFERLYERSASAHFCAWNGIIWYANATWALARLHFTIEIRKKFWC